MNLMWSNFEKIEVVRWKLKSWFCKIYIKDISITESNCHKISYLLHDKSKIKLSNIYSISWTL